MRTSYLTYPKGSPTPNQNVDTNQTIGNDQFTPKGKGGVPGHPSGKTSYPGTTKSRVTLSTDKHRAMLHADWAKGGNGQHFTTTAPGSRPRFGTEKSVGRDGFIPKAMPKVA